MDGKTKATIAALAVGGAVSFGVRKAQQKAEAEMMPGWAVLLVTLVVAAVIREAITAPVNRIVGGL